MTDTVWINPWNSHIQRYPNETIWEISVIQISHSACRKYLEGFRKSVTYQKKFITMLRILNSFQYAKEHIWRSLLILYLSYCLRKNGKVVFNFFLFPKELLEKVMPYIKKKTTHLRLPISSEEKLTLTLRFLATGESYQSLMYQYRVSDKTISKFIPEVADAIFNVLKDEYLKFPQSNQEWLEISRGIYDKW